MLSWAWQGQACQSQTCTVLSPVFTALGPSTLLCSLLSTLPSIQNKCCHKRCSSKRRQVMLRAWRAQAFLPLIRLRQWYRPPPTRGKSTALARQAWNSLGVTQILILKFLFIPEFFVLYHLSVLAGDLREVWVLLTEKSSLREWCPCSAASGTLQALLSSWRGQFVSPGSIADTTSTCLWYHLAAESTAVKVSSAGSTRHHWRSKEQMG